MFKSVIASSIVLFSLTTSGGFSSTDHIVAEEELYDSVVAQVMRGEIKESFEFNSKTYMDALWDAVVAHDAAMPQFIDSSFYSQLETADKIRFEVLQSYPNSTELSQSLLEKIESQHKNRELSLRARLELITLQSKIVNLGEFAQQMEEDLSQNHIFQNKDKKKNKKTRVVKFRDKTDEELRDLFFNTPDALSTVAKSYRNGIRMYLFCRFNRQYKCVLMMTDKDGNVALEKDGETPWHHPGLAMSRKRLPSWRRNGNTPEGVFRIDGVMPKANKKLVFGKYRRLIMNFVPPSEDEKILKQFLPESARDKVWWKSGVVARDIGRNHLRIHGSGIKRARKKDPFYPLRPTLGCVMQRELKFDGVEYHDQRKLLNKAMQTQGLKLKYENETRIKGLLYVIEIDRKQKSVTFAEMKEKLGL